MTHALWKSCETEPSLLGAEVYPCNLFTQRSLGLLQWEECGQEVLPSCALLVVGAQGASHIPWYFSCLWRALLDAWVQLTAPE